MSDTENVLKARPGWHLLDLGEVWRYRQLLWILALRDIKVRYKQAYIGAAWAVLQPLMIMGVFTVVFGLMRGMQQAQMVSYAVSLYCALLPWQLFANSVTQSSESLVVHQQLVTKVYFPRVLVPLAPIVAALIDFAIAFVILIVLMAVQRIAPTWAVLAVPLLVLFAVLIAVSIGLWLSALNALYRDFRYVVPSLIMLGFVASPVFYEAADLKLAGTWDFIYRLNPMVTVLEGMRWALLGKVAPQTAPMIASIVVVTVVLVGGLFYFRRMERLFADRV